MKVPQAFVGVEIQFLQELEANAITEGTISNYVLAIQNLKNFSDKPFKKLEKPDLVKWCTQLSHYAEGTAANYKIMAKRFLKWVHTGNLDGDGYPECVSWIKPKRKIGLPRQIFTREEIRRMVDAADTQRNRAMVYVGYESGCRAGELLGLDIKDIQLDKYGAVIRVDGKTGERRIRLVESVPDLKLWLSMHPVGKPSAPLWWSRNHQRMSYQTWYRNLRRIARRAGIEKDAAPHLMRHSRATHLAAGVLTEAQMREMFGWTKSSDMPEIYVHLSGRDVDESLLKHYGLNIEKPQEDILAPKTCPWCKAVNSPSARYCQNCNAPLDPASAGKEAEKHASRMEMVDRFFEYLRQKNPKIADDFFKRESKELEELAE